MTTKIFLASSAELKEDRKEFEILINRKNKAWKDQGVFLELIVWEDFLDAVSQTRLQDEYNKALRECDIFVMLFFTKVGPYTAEEFEAAFKQFQSTNKPFIFTYFKDAPVNTGSVDADGLMSLLLFKKKVAALGHFYTTYKNVEGLQLHFLQQLDKLVANGFIKFPLQDAADGRTGGVTYQAHLTGDGAIAQGAGAVAVGQGGVSVGGNNAGNINTGTQIRGDFVRGDKILGSKVGSQINTGGGAYFGGDMRARGDFVGRDKIAHGVSPRELQLLFAPLLAAVAKQTPADKQTAAVQQVEVLKAEVAKGEQADDSKMGRIVNGLVGIVPGAVGSVLSMFATPILGGIAGPVTKFVLDRLREK